MWNKTWLITLNSRSPRASLIHYRSKAAFIRWFVEGIVEMFSETDNFLLPGNIHVRKQGSASLRRSVRTSTVTPAQPPYLDRVIVRYKVEESPTNEQIHAHIYVDCWLNGESNVNLRQFHKIGNVGAMANDLNGQEAAWWSEYWKNRTTINMEGGAYRLALKENRVWTILASKFGWHVKPVRPHNPGRNDVVEYLLKTDTVPRARTGPRRNKFRPENPDYEEGETLAEGETDLYSQWREVDPLRVTKYTTAAERKAAPIASELMKEAQYTNRKTTNHWNTFHVVTIPT